MYAQISHVITQPTTSKERSREPLRSLLLRTQDLIEIALVELDLAAKHLLVDGPRPCAVDGEEAKDQHVHCSELVVVRVLLDDRPREPLRPCVEQVECHSLRTAARASEQAVPAQGAIVPPRPSGAAL